MPLKPIRPEGDRDVKHQPGRTTRPGCRRPGRSVGTLRITIPGRMADAVRRDQTMGSQCSGQPPDEGGEDRSVRPVQAWSRVAAPEDCDLVAQHEDSTFLEEDERPAAGSARAPAGRSDTRAATTRR